MRRDQKFKLNIEQLHFHALSENGRRQLRNSGRTTYFLYQMIGIARSKAFFGDVIYVPYDRYEVFLDNVIFDELQWICKSENLNCCVNKKERTILLRGTFFKFIKIKDQIPGDKERSKAKLFSVAYPQNIWWDNEDLLSLSKEDIADYQTRCSQQQKKVKPGIRNKSFYSMWNKATERGENEILNRYDNGDK